MILVIILIGHSKRIWYPPVKIINFFQNNPDLDPMTLVLKLDPDMIKMHYCTKNEVSMSNHSKVTVQPDRYTDSMKILPSPYVGGKKYTNGLISMVPRPCIGQR